MSMISSWQQLVNHTPGLNWLFSHTPGDFTALCFGAAVVLILLMMLGNKITRNTPE